MSSRRSKVSDLYRTPSFTYYAVNKDGEPCIYLHEGLDGDRELSIPEALELVSSTLASIHDAYTSVWGRFKAAKEEYVREKLREAGE